MKWRVISPSNAWIADDGSGRLIDRTVVTADMVQVVDGCLVFIDQIPDKDGSGFTVQPVLILSPSSWSMCAPERDG